MVVFRWVLGVLFAVLGAGAAISFGLYSVSNGELWIERARRLRRWAWLVMLLGFNVEVWRQVALTIYYWKGGAAH